MRDAYGDLVDEITDVSIGYYGASFIDKWRPGGAFSYWDLNNKQVTKVLENGVDIATKNEAMTYIDKGNLTDFSIQIGNNIMPNVILEVKWGADYAGNWTFQQELNVTTVSSDIDFPEGQINGNIFDRMPSPVGVVPRRSAWPLRMA